jgi:hypothetical protein
MFPVRFPKHPSLTSSTSFILALAGSVAMATTAVDAASYGPSSTFDAYPGLAYQFKCEDHTFGWVKFTNNYNKRIGVSFRVRRTEAGKPADFTDRVYIDPGESQEGWNSIHPDCDDGNMTVWINHVKFYAPGES